MKAVIMAGGQGTRLMPLASNQPKLMIPIVNVPCVGTAARWITSRIERLRLYFRFRGGYTSTYDR